MTTRAIILIETAVGQTRHVASRLAGVEGIQSADVVTGRYDVIAVIEASNMSAVGALVEGSIHTLDGVTRTVTCIAMDI